LEGHRATKPPSQVPAASKVASADDITGLYCTDGGNDSLAVRGANDGAIEFVLSSWQGGMHHCSAFGRAEASGDGWRHIASAGSNSDDRCVISFSINGGIRLSTDADAACLSACGARASIDGLSFPFTDRITPTAAPRYFDDREYFMNQACR
jgi:hypothetical protein